MTDTRVRSLEAVIVSLPRDVPYLGPLGSGETVNANGYFIRKGNRTVYPSTDTSVLIKATAEDGTIGWGETYGIAAPQAVVALIDDLLAPFVVGREADEAAVIWQDLYDMQRVRGASGGYYGDAIAGIEIALSDLAARIEGIPLCSWLGGNRVERIPAYASGLPRATLDERVDLARQLAGAGFRAVKFAAPVAWQGIVDEMRALRAALGPAIDIMVDLHWKYEAPDAIGLARELAPYHPKFIEAPCAPEDIAALERVAATSSVPIAVGEEWRNIYEARLRLDTARIGVVQPEMAHTGTSQFMAIARHAAARGAALAPHATVGVGIFLAASLHATAALGREALHEYQHSIFDRNLAFVETTMRCEAGYYHVPTGPGHGVTPRDSLWSFVRR